MKRKNRKANRKGMSLLCFWLAATAMIWSLARPIPLVRAEAVIPEDSAFSRQAAGSIDQADVQRSLAQLPVYFEENRGQFNGKVRYFARGTSGYDLFLTATEAVYVLHEPVRQDRSETRRDDAMSRLNDRATRTSSRKSTAVFMALVGANPDSLHSGSEMLEHRTNYFKGAESQWRTEIPNYGRVRMSDVYDGIDAVWHGREAGGVQYDFVVRPNADPGRIAWDVKGADSVELDAEGNLLIKTEHGEIKQNKPFTYQEESGIRREIESRFVVERSRTSKVGFELGDYDRTKPLVIDPSVNLSNLSFSTLLGGSFNDFGAAIEADGTGNIYVTGTTLSPEFPTTAGAYDTTHNGNYDVFVTKLNAAGSALSYSTFIGGSNTESSNSIAVDSAGNAFVTGYIFDGTTDYPTTAGAYDTTHNGSADVFVTKLNAAGSALSYSTFIGGSSDDYGYGIAVDSAGNAFVTGLTFDATTDYPTTAGAYDTTHNGDYDVFVTKLNAAGSALSYSTFIGGNSDDRGWGIAVDSAGNAFVTGFSLDGTTDYPTTAGAYDTTHNGFDDVVVTKLNAAGSALSYSTFIGGSSDDNGYGIAVDSAGNAFITGSTFDATTDYPTTVGAYDTTHNGNYDVFVTKLNAAGSALSYSTLIGGSSTDRGNSIAVDSAGNAYVTGYTIDGTTDYPTTAGAYDTTHNGFDDVVVTKLNAAGSALSYSTLIGGSSADRGNSIAVDSAGNAFVTGYTVDDATAYPTTAEVVQPEHNGGQDSFVSKLGDYSISGRSVDTSGLPLANTAIGFSGDCDGFMLSDAQGNFSLSDTILNGNCLVSATQILYNFNPGNYQVTVNRNKRLTFVGRPTTSGPTVAFGQLGGEVVSTAGNIGLPFTDLTLIDTYGNPRTTTTDAQGNYRFDNVQLGGSYVVFAQREGYTVTPAAQYVNFLEPNLDIDFSARPNSPRPAQDFDGDGKTDLAVFRPAEGRWYILQSQTNSLKVVRFGADGDIPLAEDFDGDRRADITVYRPSDGNWYRLNSSDGAFSAIRFGLAEDKPVPADYDGDGRADIAVYRPSTGVWHRLNSRDDGYVAVKWGIPTDTPVPADFDSDGKADLNVFRDGTWYRLNSGDNQVTIRRFGTADDRPMAADFDGDGRADMAVFRPSDGSWHSLDNLDGEYHTVRFGAASDIPVPADYNGDGRIEHGIYRAGMWYQLYANGNTRITQFGAATDIPLTAVR